MSAEVLRKRKKTLNALIGTIRQALLMAWENGHVENERAWRCIRYLPNVDRPRIIFANRQECRRLVDACAPDLRSLVLAGLYSGCRISELQLMTVGDYVAERYGLNVPLVKTRRPRFVFLPDEGCELFEVLSTGRTVDKPMFVRSDGRSWSNDYRHHFKAAVVKAGLSPKFSFHSLRHTYASQLIQAGTPLTVISDQLGHVSTNTVSRTYGHMAPQIREAEVRQRFTPITGTPISSTIVRNRPAPYAVISDLRAVQD
jgi:integrase